MGPVSDSPLRAATARDEPVRAFVGGSDDVPFGAGAGCEAWKKKPAAIKTLPMPPRASHDRCRTRGEAWACVVPEVRGFETGPVGIEVPQRRHFVR